MGRRPTLHNHQPITRSIETSHDESAEQHKARKLLGCLLAQAISYSNELRSESGDDDRLTDENLSELDRILSSFRYYSPLLSTSIHISFLLPFPFILFHDIFSSYLLLRLSIFPIDPDFNSDEVGTLDRLCLMAKKTGLVPDHRRVPLHACQQEPSRNPPRARHIDD